MMKKIIRSGVLATMIVGMLSGTAMAAQKAPRRGQAPRIDATPMNGQQAFGRFIITYKDGSAARNNPATITRDTGQALSRAGLSTKARPVNAVHLRKLAIGADLVKTSRKLDRVEAEAFMRQIATDPNVASVTIDQLRRPVLDFRAPASLQPQTFIPDDTLFRYQWHLNVPDGTKTVNDVANAGGSNVTNAWDLADGNGVVIAVLDTGLTRHEDIDTSLADAGYDFISDGFVSGRDSDDRVPGGWDTGDWTNEEPWLSACTNAQNPPSPSSWHGTHVASTTGAEKTNNALGMAGIAHNAKVLPVRVLGHCGGYDSDINDAIVWAAGGHVDGVPDNAHPAQVINLSLGGGGTCSASDPAAQAVALANSLGATVVVSAGNSNANAADFTPASCPGVITVAATGITSRRAFYSNYGATVEIAAPGGGAYANDGSSGSLVNDGFIWQAVNDGATVPTDEYQYGGLAGTSQAAPHVSGTVALMQGARADAELPPLTPAEVLSILQRTAHAPSVTPSQPIGAGIVDAYAAVMAAVGDDGGCTEDCGLVAIPLTNKVDVTGLSGNNGSEALYSFEAKAGQLLNILTLGGTGDVSLYVSFGQEPTAANAQFKSERPGNNETVRVTAPQAGTYYIKLVGKTAYNGLTLVARQ